jgi:iron(III) transport system permease protein
MKPSCLFTGIILFFFVIFIVIPVCYILLLPACDFESINIFEIRHLGLMKKSFILASGTAFFALIIGLPTAFFLFQLSARYKPFFMFFLVIPVLIPTYIHAIVWNQIEYFLNESIFAINIHSMEGAIFILTLSYFSYITLIVYSGLHTMDKNLIEISLLSSGKFKSFYRIILPLLFPYIFAGTMFVFIFSIIDFGVPDMLRLNVYPIEIFVQFSAFYNEKAAMTLSFPIIVLTICLIIMQKNYMKDRSYFQIVGDLKKQRVNLFASDPMWVIILPVIFLSSIVPVIVLIIKAGNYSNYLEAWSGSKSQIFYSIFVSSASAMSIIILSFFIAYLITRLRKGFLASTMDIISMIPLAIPASTVGICMIKVWNQPVVDFAYSNSLIIIFGHIVRFIPFGVMIIMSGLRNINTNVEEAALLITPRKFTIMLNILLPLLRPSLFVGFFIIFLLSFSELGTTLLIMPPGHETIPVKIYNLIHYGAYELVNALCLILIFMIIVISGLFLFLYQKLINQQPCNAL